MSDDSTNQNMAVQDDNPVTPVEETAENTPVIASEEAEAKQSSEDTEPTQIASSLEKSTGLSSPRNDGKLDETKVELEDVAVEPQSEEEGTSESSKTTTSAQDMQKLTAQDDNPNARWYVVHTYSGHENKVAATLKQRVESERLEKKILDVLVPTQDKIEIKSGKKATIKEKIFPGYILVKMVLDDDSWLAVRTTQGVTSFVGIGNKPTPISNAEVQTIVRFTSDQAPVYKQVFQADDTVKIVEGPFAEFIGKVDSVDEEKGKVRVLVSIFGRETPVELDFLQVQKI